MCKSIAIRVIANIRIVHLITGFVLVFGSLTGCPPPRWNPCECEDDEFTLTVINLLGGGSISISPEKDKYRKGDYVTLTFTPNSNGFFYMWTCAPASHLASDCENPSTGVYISDHTIVIAWGGNKARTLSLRWDQSFGTVEDPPDSKSLINLISCPVNYGDTITLKATPNDGYFTTWHGQWHHGDWSGERYSDDIKIKISGDHKLEAWFRPLNEKPSLTNSVTVNTIGGDAEVFSAAAPSASYSAGPYLEGSASGPGRFAFSIIPRPGIAYNYLTWVVGNQTWYSTSSAFTNEVTVHAVMRSNEGAGRPCK